MIIENFGSADPNQSLIEYAIRVGWYQSSQLVDEIVFDDIIKVILKIKIHWINFRNKLTTN